MSTLYQYLAIIGWAWCVVVAIVLSVLVWRKNRRERVGFEVQIFPPPAAGDVASDSHAK